MEDKYLPIGTVVLLKEAKKEIMITGYLPIPNGEEEIMYDYSACLYPEGIISSDQVIVFNHEQIEKIYYKGFESEQYKEVNEKLKKIQR